MLEGAVQDREATCAIQCAGFGSVVMISYASGKRVLHSSTGIGSTSSRLAVWTSARGARRFRAISAMNSLTSSPVTLAPRPSIASAPWWTLDIDEWRRRQ